MPPRRTVTLRVRAAKSVALRPFRRYHWVMENDEGPLRRVLAGPAGRAVDVLAGLSGADLVTAQLEVARRRAVRLRGPDVLRRHRNDRFVAPSPLPFEKLRHVEDVLLATLPPEFARVTLAPLVPLGTHSAVTGLAQHRVVATGRGTEVAADPTSGLAMEAAVRRTDGPVRLAALQRIVRAQHVDGARFFAHFSMLGLVTAGRDSGDLGFEREHVVEHARYLAAASRALGASGVELKVTVLHERFSGLTEELRAALPDVRVTPFPEREGGRGYYEGLCFKVLADFGETVEVGDGGFTVWTRRLLGNAKERLMTSGLGVDRLVSVAAG